MTVYTPLITKQIDLAISLAKKDCPVTIELSAAEWKRYLAENPTCVVDSNFMFVDTNRPGVYITDGYTVVCSGED